MMNICFANEKRKEKKNSIIYKNIKPNDLTEGKTMFMTRQAHGV